MFIPIWESSGGLFPEDDDTNFFDIMSMVLDGTAKYNKWDILLTLSFFVPSLLLLITAFIGKKWPFLLASVLAIIIWLVRMIGYFNQYSESRQGYDALSYRLDLHSGDIAIGTWLTILFFAVALIAAILSKNKRSSE